MPETQTRERPAASADDTKRMDKVLADQKKTADEAEKKAKEDREKEREAAVEHGSILDEEYAKRLDEQDEKEKKYNEEQAELVRAGGDPRLRQQAGAADDRAAHSKR